MIKKRALSRCSNCGLAGHNIQKCPDPGKPAKANNSSSSSSSSAPSNLAPIIDRNLALSVIAEFEELNEFNQDFFEDIEDDDEPRYPLDGFGAEIFPNEDIIAGLNNIIEQNNIIIHPMAAVPLNLDDEDIFNLIWEEVEIIEQENRSIRARLVPISTIPVFKGPTDPHPKNIPADCVTRLDCFRLFMDDAIVANFVTNTNGYARDSKKANWKDIDEGDVMRLFAVMFFMGIVKIPDRRRYWEKEPSLFGQPFVQDCFGARRFDQILSCFHWVNTALFTEQEKKLKKKDDPFYQVAGFLEALDSNFRCYYTLGQYFDIDEISIYFKGRHICRCYNPNKPHKWHFKAFALNCSKTGYLYSF